MCILRRRAPRRGEAPDLAAGGQDPMAGNDQRHRILGHSLADIARGLRAGAELLGQRAVRGDLAPSDLPRRRIDALKKFVLPSKVEDDLRKIRLLSFEI